MLSPAPARLSTRIGRGRLPGRQRASAAAPPSIAAMRCLKRILGRIADPRVDVADLVQREQRSAWSVSWNW